jgi:hypothetical protein
MKCTRCMMRSSVLAEACSSRNFDAHQRRIVGSQAHWSRGSCYGSIRHSGLPFITTSLGTDVNI